MSLLVLLISLGAETDIPLIRSLGRPAAWVIAGSIVIPGVAGVATAYALPDDLLGAHRHRLAFALLIAGAMSVSSLPVVARIITELDMTRRNVGQLTVAGATANDGYGFLLLAVVLALVGGGSSNLITALVGLVVLSVVVATLGRRAVDALLRRTRRDGRTPWRDRGCPHHDPHPGGRVAGARAGCSVRRVHRGHRARRLALHPAAGDDVDRVDVRCVLRTPLLRNRGVVGRRDEAGKASTAAAFVAVLVALVTKFAGSASALVWPGCPP